MLLFLLLFLLLLPGASYTTFTFSLVLLLVLVGFWILTGRVEQKSKDRAEDKMLDVSLEGGKVLNSSSMGASNMNSSPTRRISPRAVVTVVHDHRA